MIEDERDNGQAAARTATHENGGVSLHIERLVIEGVPFGAGQAEQLGETIQRELTRLIQRDGLGFSGQGGALRALAAPSIQISDPLRPADLGRRIARSVYESLTRGV